jgi:hypothetical protein
MSVRDALERMGLPGGDLQGLPDAKRFPDGAEYRVEIPSTEGPRCLEGVLEEAERLCAQLIRGRQIPERGASCDRTPTPIKRVRRGHDVGRKRGGRRGPPLISCCCRHG